MAYVFLAVPQQFVLVTLLLDVLALQVDSQGENE